MFVNSEYRYMAFNLPFVLTAASVGLSTGFIIHYFTKRNEEIFVTAEDIYVYGAIDKVAIEAGGKDIILTRSAKEKLRRLLNIREKSSSMYI